MSAQPWTPVKSSKKAAKMPAYRSSEFGYPKHCAYLCHVKAETPQSIVWQDLPTRTSLHQKMKRVLSGQENDLSTKKKTSNMASRKALKKGINYIVGELFTECVYISLTLPEADKAKADKVMTDILDMQDDFVSRISHTEPGNVKGFYKKLREDFNARVSSILEAMGQLKN